VGTEGDLVRFRRWLGQLSVAVQVRAGQDYAQDVPLRAVQDQLSNQVTRGSLGGSHGDTLVALENNLAAVGSDWVSLVNQLADLNNDLAMTHQRIKTEDDNANGKIKQLNFAIDQAIIERANQVVQGIAQIVSKNVIGGIGNIVSGGEGLGVDIGSLEAQIQAVKDDQGNVIAQDLLDLTKRATDTVTALEKTLTALRTDVNNVTTNGQDLHGQEEQAAYLAAQALGADYVTAADGTQTSIPLNTVLRRQFDGTRNRYLSALNDAKGLAFIARRAIEQRLGVSMSDMHDAVGPLDPPATWADSVCHMTGINYTALQGVGASVSADAGADGAAVVLDPATGGGDYDRSQIDAYADGFIGDYVAKLQNFVDYYNIQYPSHQADDMAVLSVREDFLPKPPACMRTGANLLYYSSQLQMLEVDDAAGHGTPGWQYTPCESATKCLYASATPYEPYDLPPLDAIRGHVTQLVDQAASQGAGATSGSDAGADGSAGAPDPRVRVIPGAPPGLIVQAVRLDPGAYVLSWWDQARTADPLSDGGLDTQAYVANVFDASWNALVNYSDPAYVPVTMPDWSTRRVLAFSVQQSGVYYVGFGASAVGAPAGAVAISGVQLEATKSNGNPTAYIDTGYTRDAYSSVCPAPSAADLQNAFTRRCDDPSGACYYELNHPLAIDSVALQTGQSPLAGKIAQGNFNYRHLYAALNLVGTGVHSCPDGSSPSCYGSAYIEFSLDHAAEDVPILDWTKTPHYFDFRTGRVSHGKALAAERYITVPLGSDDQSLITQPGIQRIELQGRPLDGRYHLRIWDNPALRWDRLQDVQIVLQYRYWSRVDQTTPGASP
jgi:hypothetical protein